MVRPPVARLGRGRSATARYCHCALTPPGSRPAYFTPFNDRDPAPAGRWACSTSAPSLRRPAGGRSIAAFVAQSLTGGDYLTGSNSAPLPAIGGHGPAKPAGSVCRSESTADVDTAQRPRGSAHDARVGRANRRAAAGAAGADPELVRARLRRKRVRWRCSATELGRKMSEPINVVRGVPAAGLVAGESARGACGGLFAPYLWQPGARSRHYPRRTGRGFRPEVSGHTVCDDAAAVRRDGRSLGPQPHTHVKRDGAPHDHRHSATR